MVIDTAAAAILLPGLAKEFLELLIVAQGLRPFRQAFDGTRYAWNVIECQTMLEAVNRVRADAGRPLATLEDIYRAERGAVGHSDYSSKFALYCAELALQLHPWHEDASEKK